MSNNPLPTPPGRSRPAAGTPLRSWRNWWHSQSPTRQDRLAVLAPLASVLLFLAAITAAFWYLQVEEIDRGQEAVTRDVEYAQQRVRLRLLERQEQLMRLARDVSNKDVDSDEFISRSESLEAQYPELLAITWINARRRIIASRSAPSVPLSQQRVAGDILKIGDTENSYSLARELQQPVYAQPTAHPDRLALLQLHIPLADGGKFAGVVLAESSLADLLRYGVPAEVMAKYAVSLLDDKGHVLAGNTVPAHNPGSSLLPWSAAPNQ